MYIYKNKETKQIVHRDKKDEELENSDEWEFVIAYQNTQLNKDNIIRK